MVLWDAIVAQRSYVQNGAVAVSATWREKIVVVGLAVRLALPLEEIPRAQLLITVGAREVFRMPCFSQSGDHLKEERDKKARSFYRLTRDIRQWFTEGFYLLVPR